MEIEIQGMPQSIRQPYTARAKSSKSDLARYKKLARDMHTQAARAELLSNVSGSPFRDSVDGEYDEGGAGARNGDRTRLLAGTSLLEDGSRRLADSQRVALETEQTGAEILRNLRGQREQIEHARDTVSLGAARMVVGWYG
jgi:vesicle transport through interaction with t-SNAREs protein 1